MARNAEPRHTEGLYCAIDFLHLLFVIIRGYMTALMESFGLAVNRLLLTMQMEKSP